MILGNVIVIEFEEASTKYRLYSSSNVILVDILIV